MSEEICLQYMPLSAILEAEINPKEHELPLIGKSMRRKSILVLALVLLFALLALLLLPVCAWWTLLLTLWARAGFYVP